MSLFIFMILLSLMAHSSPESWGVIGSTVRCPEEIILKSKEGANNVLVRYKSRSYLLFPDGNYTFQKNSAINLVFNSYNRKSDFKYPEFEYIHPSSASGNHGKLEIKTQNKTRSCKVKLD